MTFHLRAGRLKEVSRTREPVFALDPLFVTLLCAGVLANFYPIPYFAGLSFYLGSTATYMMFLLFGWQRACVCACAVSLAQAAVAQNPVWIPLGILEALVMAAGHARILALSAKRRPRNPSGQHHDQLMDPKSLLVMSGAHWLVLGLPLQYILVTFAFPDALWPAPPHREFSMLRNLVNVLLNLNLALFLTCFLFWSRTSRGPMSRHLAPLSIPVVELGTSLYFSTMTIGLAALLILNVQPAHRDLADAAGNTVMTATSEINRGVERWFDKQADLLRDVGSAALSFEKWKAQTQLAELKQLVASYDALRVGKSKRF